MLIRKVIVTGAAGLIAGTFSIAALKLVNYVCYQITSHEIRKEIVAAQRRLSDFASAQTDNARDNYLYRPVYTYAGQTSHLHYSDNTSGKALPFALAICTKQEATTNQSCQPLGTAFNRAIDDLQAAREMVKNGHNATGQEIESLISVPAPPFVEQPAIPEQLSSNGHNAAWQMARYE